jgi:hypothetical protein
MKKFGSLVVFAWATLGLNAQISSGKVEEPKKEETKVKAPKEKRVPTEGTEELVLFGGAAYAKSFRELKENVSPYGDPLGERANETGINVFSYQLGARNRINHFLSYEAGLSFDKYGEAYKYNATEDDSTFSYTNKYAFVSLPIQVFYTYGKDFRFFIGGGIQPMLATKFTYEEKYTDSLGSESSSKIRSTERMAGVSLNLVASAGIQWRFSKALSLYFIPMYAYGITNSYAKQEPYKHYVRGLHYRFGITLHIPNKE